MGAQRSFRQHEIDWERVRSHLDQRGFAVLPGVLSKKICEEIAAGYSDDRQFRTRIEMSRYSLRSGINTSIIRYPR